MTTDNCYENKRQLSTTEVRVEFDLGYRLRVKLGLQDS